MSVDAGAALAQRALPDKRAVLSSVTCTSMTNCVAVGALGSGGDARRDRHTDGGAHWR